MHGSRSASGLKRVLAASVLAGVALLAMVPAFACTPTSTAQIRPARGTAGSTAEVSGSLFKPEFNVVVKWGGASGVVLATSRVNPDGSFGPVPVTVPADTPAGKTSVLAVYQPDDPSAKVSNVTFEVPGPPVTETPPQQPVPTIGSTPQPSGGATSTPVPAPAAATSPAPSSESVAAVRVQPAPVAATRPVAAAAPAAPAVPVETAAVPETTVQVPGAAPPAATVQVPAAPIPSAAPDLRPAPATAPGSIDGGPSLWVLVPLVALGLTLFAASAAFVVHEVRRRRRTVRV